MAILDRGPVVCAKLTHPGPVHLRRSARLFYTHDKWRRNKRAWMNEITRAAEAWHADHEQRFA
eukprot:6944075-Prymnesium_polylepis.1